MKSDEKNETHDRMIVHSDKTGWLRYDRKNLHISMKIVKIYDKISNKWQNWIKILQHSSKNQFIKKIIISNIPIDKNNQIKEVLYRLHEDEKKWIYKKQKEMIYIIMNDMNSLICIFSIEDEKMILIMILVIFNKSKIIIIMILYISLINDLEKWYKSMKINYFHWISNMMQRIIIIIIIFDIEISKKFQIYI